MEILLFFCILRQGLFPLHSSGCPVTHYVDRLDWSPPDQFVLSVGI